MLMPRPQFTLTSPLGTDLRFHAMTHTAELSKLGSTLLTLLSPRADLAPEDLLGQAVTVTARLREGQRFFHGHVTRFGLVGHEGRHFKYRARLCPWPWFLTRTSDCRIFQDQSVPDIIKTVFQDHAVAEFEFHLSRPYRSRTYCVQYRETDYDFVARLLADEGIYWHVRHAEDRHTLVLQDNPSAHGPASGCEALPYIADAKAVQPDTECISAWDFSRGVRPGRFEVASYDFERPHMDLRAGRDETRGHGMADHERFDFQGDYTQADDGHEAVAIRLEEEQARHERLGGLSNAHGLAVGQLFGLQRHPREDQNRQYLCVSTTIKVEPEGAEAGQGPGGFSCEFTALPARRQFRPPFGRGKPVMRGPQTAVVTGPAGQEIHTDRHGRVRVHFHWDRRSQRNERSSCWMRVASPWAGTAFGFIQVPRIGQEVIVDFLEGDPDQPIITGRVYNGDHLPPWELPANATQSGVLTRSSQGGAYNHANALRFEDKKGEEQVWLHAEKDQDIEVENDETHWVGRDRRKTIDRHETVQVKGHRTETVDLDETITVHQNRSERVDLDEKVSVGLNRTEDVGVNETITIGANRSVTIGGAKTETVALAKAETIGLAKALSIGLGYQVSVGAAMNTTVAGLQAEEIGLHKQSLVGRDYGIKVGATYSVAAKDEIHLVVGKASLTMKADGTIAINGHTLSVGTTAEQTFRADGDVTVKGKKIQEN
jgi:type VI secretion system secreted protein VgrG